MARFRDLFRVRRKQHDVCQKSSTSTAKPASDDAVQAPPSIHSSGMADRAVAGMQRSNQGTYITAYSSTRPSNPSSGKIPQTSTLTASSKTAVDDSYPVKGSESTWKGMANGTLYDKREELTPEDEDMWAKMAM